MKLSKQCVQDNMLKKGKAIWMLFVDDDVSRCPCRAVFYPRVIANAEAFDTLLFMNRPEAKLSKEHFLLPSVISENHHAKT